MECAAKGIGRCAGEARRRCGQCGAVAYCSTSHQVSHWSVHKQECERLKQQMSHAHILHHFPFTFSTESTLEICEKKMSRCDFLTKRNLHQVGMWKYECRCGVPYSTKSSRIYNDWNLPNHSCPCCEPPSPIPVCLSSWKDYYEWRCIPFCSPIALLLHWLARSRMPCEATDQLRIHYLGPERELLQLAAFAELQALFPGFQVHIELIGPAIPKSRDGEKIDLCSYSLCIEKDCVCKFGKDKCCQVGKTSGVTLKLHRGFYHDRYTDIVKESFPHLVFAANAGVAAYSSWLPTIELIKDIEVAAVFSDYCEEAAHLATSCISSVTGCPLSIPIQLNPFRQPMVVEDSALYLPCYSNCFLFGM